MGEPIFFKIKLAIWVSCYIASYKMKLTKPGFDLPTPYCDSTIQSTWWSIKSVILLWRKVFEKSVNLKATFATNNIFRNLIKEAKNLLCHLSIFLSIFRYRLRISFRIGNAVSYNFIR